jgi:hypothetical protein
MKAKSIFLVFFITVLHAGKMNAQIMPTITKVALQEQDRATLSQHVSEYAVFTIDKRALIDSLSKKWKMSISNTC